MNKLEQFSADKQMLTGDIAWRKGVEAAFEELSRQMERRERMLTSLLSSLTDFAYSFDRAGRVLFANQPQLDFWGLTLTEAVGKAFIDLKYPNDLARKYQRQIQEVFANKQTITDEAVYTSPEGLKSCYEYIFSPVCVPDGTVECVIGSARDITSRKKAECTIPSSEERLRKIIDLLPHGVFAKDFAGRHIFANPALAEMAGLSIEHIIGKTDFELVTDKAEAEAYRADDLAVIRSWEKLVIAEEPRTDLSGRTRILQTIKIPFTTGETNEAAVLGVCVDITERKRIELSLQESEERFRSLFAATATGMAISTPDGYFLEVNAAYCRMLDYTEDELRTRNFASLTHPEDLDLNLKLRDEVLAAKRDSFAMEKRYLKKNGDIVWTRQSVSAIRTAKGRISRLVVVAEDITERKQAERALLEQTAELQVLFDLMPAMLCFKDTKNNFRRVNQRLAEAAGRLISDIEGKSAADIFPLESDKYYLDDLEIIQTRTAKLGIVEKFTNLDGKGAWVQTDKVPVSDEKGNVTGIIVMVQDITQRKSMEDRLYRLNRLHAVLSKVFETLVRTRERQDLYDAVCGILKDFGKLRMVFVVELDAEVGLTRLVASCSNGRESPVGRTSAIPLDGGPMSEGTIGTSLLRDAPDVCNDIAGAARMKPWHELASKYGLRSNASLPFHLYGVTIGALVLYAEEKDYFLEDEIRLLVSLAGAVSLALEAFEKENLRQRAEETIKTLNLELEQRVVRRTSQLEAANKELEAFSYSVSHDLRAPLRAVNGFTRMVLQEFGSQLPEVAQRHLERACNGAKRMGELIDDLLAFSQLAHQSMRWQVVDLAKILQAVLDESISQREGREIEIHVGKLPVAMGDPALLNQVWVNLISNAVKYTRRRERAVVEVGCERKNNENVFFVRDNGAGFDMQYADKLFGVFQRLHRTDEFEGTGVGLAIVQRIVSRHGGRIWAEAEVGKGAAFYFTLGGEDNS